MKLTERGLKFIVIVTLMAIFALIYRDLLIAFLTLTSLLAIFLDLFSLKLKIGGVDRLALEPDILNVRLVAGESRVEKMCVASSNLPRDLAFKHSSKWLKIEPSLGENKVDLYLIIEPKLSGEYALDGLEVELSSRFGFFRGFGYVPVKLYVKVYPRVLPWILRVVKFILVGGLPELGGLPIKKKGLGLEYFESRDYVPGDSIKFIDWKASARLSKLIVKEFHEETFGSMYVVYDVRAFGPVTSDVLAALFLSTMLGAAGTGLPISLIIKSGDKLIYSASSLPSIEALKVALSYVLELQKFSEWDFYELVEPRSSRKIFKLLEKFRAEGLAKILKFRLKREIKLPLISLVRGGGRIDMLYVGLILYDPRFIVELFDEVKVRGHRLRIFTPSKPWLDAKGLEEAYLMYESFNKIISSLNKLGVEVRLS